KTPDIWVRRTFDLDDVNGKTFALKMYHDEDAEVYVNGVKVLETKGYVTDFTVFELDPSVMKAFKAGKNTISIHCRQTMGGQYIDCGVVTIE
ncbi:MAG: glycoside hydrolase family 2, partial [Thermoguttaceae bacterium]